ncbi:MAG TPA: hypothetical protein VHQ45_07915 [Gemmatimonadaceae bacterium]|nr:hypothetical protein [Gemmatimonadaceae bacterium]
MRSRSRVACGAPAAAARAAALALAVAVVPSASSAQDTALGQASALETAGTLREAAAAYREAVREGAVSSGVLGLERVYAELGWTDSLLPALDSLIRAHPHDETLRTVQLRSLQRAGREPEARAAWERWTRRDATDPMPYRQYARILLDAGRTAAADSVLRAAQGALGSGRQVALELAQLRATMGLWAASAQSWREALDAAPYLDQATIYALRPAPDSARAAIRRALAAPPVAPGARRALATLSLLWGDPAGGWAAIRDLPPTDSSAAVWVEFGDRAAESQAWLVARDAYVAALAHHQSPEIAARGAAAALAGGDAASALAIVERALERALERTGQGSEGGEGGELLTVHVRALSALGRPADAERVVRRAGALPPDASAVAERELALAWARAGDLPAARQALQRAGADPQDEAYGWLALYAGDLATARRLLRYTDEQSPEALAARALLVRTRVDSAPKVGEAFLLLARGDRRAAAGRFAEAATLIPDAAPALIATAARLQAEGGDLASAAAHWGAILERWPAAPEAAEADLAWARALRAAGDTAAATQRLEHLILTYPQSALVPQARRELDLARPSVGRPQH